jgi:hypothetical protein
MANVNIPTLQEFIALARGGFSRADRFVVNFNVPPALPGASAFYNLRDFSMLCEEAAFPGKTIGTRTLRINALNEQRAHTVDYMGDSITFQFIVDLNWSVRRFFEDWMNVCVGNETVTGDRPSITREVGYYQDYISNISINSLIPRHDGVSSFTQLDKSTQYEPSDVSVTQPPEVSNFQMNLYEAWPRNMNVQQVSYGSQTFHRLNITFTYKYYTTTYTPEIVPTIPLATIDPLTQALSQAKEQVISAGKGLTGLLQTRKINISKKLTDIRIDNLL